MAAIDALPDLHVKARNCQTDEVGCELAGSELEFALLKQKLEALHPWRKGPFKIGPWQIDTEWRSDWKWRRLANTLGRLDGLRVLDIGCGNGYFGWRMLGAGAAEVVGIDPTLLFCMQHQAIQRYMHDGKSSDQGNRAKNWVLPLGIEDIPTTHQFDRVFSMGVLYHRRDPAEHIQQVFQLTAPGGQAVVETLIVDSATSLLPPGRYARMRNVWCIPNLSALEQWMLEAGFTDVTVVNVSETSTEEQRSTPWMRFESLQHSLDPNDLSRTVEGHPRPLRAIVSGARA